MYCPFCSCKDTRVLDSRLVSGGSQVRRRRVCPECGERFNTFEEAQLVMPRVIKQNGQYEPFDVDKMRRGFQKALEKRAISVERIESSIEQICHHLRTLGEREVPSRLIGDCVMDALRELDQVAYIRFASVYRRFEDISAYRTALDDLESTTDLTRLRPRSTRKTGRSTDSQQPELPLNNAE